MIKKYSKEDWIKLVKEFDLGALNKTNWCKKRNINCKTFGYWYARYGNESTSKFKKNEKENNQLSNGISITTPKVTRKDKPHTVTKSDSWIELKIAEPFEAEISKSYTSTINVSHDDLPNNKLENINRKSNLIIKIGKAEIKIEEGFDKYLLIDVSKALGEIC